MLAPDRVRSTQGESNTAADGCERPASRAATSAASASPTTSGLADERDPSGRHAGFEETPIDGQRIVDGGGRRMLWREPIFDGQHLGPGLSSHEAGESTAGSCRTQREHCAVEVLDSGVRVGSERRDFEDRDAVKRPSFSRMSSGRGHVA